MILLSLCMFVCSVQLIYAAAEKQALNPFKFGYESLKEASEVQKPTVYSIQGRLIIEFNKLSSVPSNHIFQPDYTQDILTIWYPLNNENKPLYGGLDWSPVVYSEESLDEKGIKYVCVSMTKDSAVSSTWFRNGEKITNLEEFSELGVQIDCKVLKEVYDDFFWQS